MKGTLPQSVSILLGSVLVDGTWKEKNFSLLKSEQRSGKVPEERTIKSDLIFVLPAIKEK